MRLSTYHTVHISAELDIAEEFKVNKYVHNHYHTEFLHSANPSYIIIIIIII